MTEHDLDERPLPIQANGPTPNGKTNNIITSASSASSLAASSSSAEENGEMSSSAGTNGTTSVMLTQMSSTSGSATGSTGDLLNPAQQAAAAQAAADAQIERKRILDELESLGEYGADEEGFDYTIAIKYAADLIVNHPTGEIKEGTDEEITVRQRSTKPVFLAKKYCLWYNSMRPPLAKNGKGIQKGFDFNALNEKVKRFFGFLVSFEYWMSGGWYHSSVVETSRRSIIQKARIFNKTFLVVTSTLVHIRHSIPNRTI